MGAAKKAGGDLSSGVKSLGNADSKDKLKGAAIGGVAGIPGMVAGGIMGADKLEDKVKGLGDKVGLGGGGKYNPKAYDINEKSFTDTTASRAQRKSFSEGLAEAAGRDAPSINAAQIAQAPQEQFRGSQLGLAQALEAQARGEGPSLAQRQLQQGTDRTIAQAMALAASQRGRSAGQGLRQIQQAAAQAQQMQAAQSADLAMQEQLAARQQLAGVLQSGRGQDIGLATSQAQLGQQADLANQASNLQQQQIADAMTRYYQTGVTGLDTRDLTAAQELERLKLGQQQNLEQIKAGQAAAKMQQQSNQLGALGQAAVGLGAAFSDKNLKTDIKPGDEKISSFLDALKAYEYKYKDPAMGAGDQVGPMAQDLEKTDIGQQMVEDTPDGKMVDYSKAGGVMLAGQAMLKDKIDDLEMKLAEVLKKRSAK